MFDGTSLMDPLTRPWIIESTLPLCERNPSHIEGRQWQWRQLHLEALLPTEFILLSFSAIKYWQNLKEQFRLRERHAGRAVYTSRVRTALQTSCRKVYAHVLRSNGSINVTSEGPCIRPAFERLYKRHVGRSVNTFCVRTALRTRTTPKYTRKWEDS